jgi:hypothetical protein
MTKGQVLSQFLVSISMLAFLAWLQDHHTLHLAPSMCLSILTRGYRRDLTSSRSSCRLRNVWLSTSVTTCKSSCGALGCHHVGSLSQIHALVKWSPSDQCLEFFLLLPSYSHVLLTTGLPLPLTFLALTKGLRHYYISSQNPENQWTSPFTNGLDQFLRVFFFFFLFLIWSLFLMDPCLR